MPCGYLEWKGFTFQILLVYCPAQPSERALFLSHTLPRFLHPLPLLPHVFVMGDFNFSTDAHRRPASTQALSHEAVVEALLPDHHLSDVQTALRPLETPHTFFSPRTFSTSRLDRILAPSLLLRHMTSINHAPLSPLLTDHSYAPCVTLQHPTHPTLRKGFWRLNVSLLSHEHAQSFLSTTLPALSSRPWTAVKKRISRFFKGLARSQHARRLTTLQ